MICLILHKDLEEKEICKKKIAPVSSTDELLLSCTSQRLWHGDQPPTLIIWYDMIFWPSTSQLFLLPEVKSAFKGKISGQWGCHKLHNSQTKHSSFGCLQRLFVQLLEGCKKCTVITGDYFEGKWNSSVLISCSRYSIYPWTWCHHIRYGHLKKRKISRPRQE